MSGVSGAAGVVIKDAIFLMGGQLTNRRYPQEILGESDTQNVVKNYLKYGRQIFDQFSAINCLNVTGIRLFISVLWPHSNEWERIGEMKLARRGFHTAFLNGYLYVIGGNDKVGNEVFDMANFYDRQVCTEPNRNVEFLTDEAINALYPV